MNTTGIDKSKGQCSFTLYLYPRHLFYFAVAQAISMVVA
jgi:hypothetical protein